MELNYQQSSYTLPILFGDKAFDPKGPLYGFVLEAIEMDIPHPIAEDERICDICGSDRKTFGNKVWFEDVNKIKINGLYIPCPKCQNYYDKNIYNNNNNEEKYIIHELGDVSLQRLSMGKEYRNSYNNFNSYWRLEDEYGESNNILGSFTQYMNPTPKNVDTIIANSNNGISKSYSFLSDSLEEIEKIHSYIMKNLDCRLQKTKSNFQKKKTNELMFDERYYNIFKSGKPKILCISSINMSDSKKTICPVCNGDKKILLSDGKEYPCRFCFQGTVHIPVYNLYVKEVVLDQIVSNPDSFVIKLTSPSNKEDSLSALDITFIKKYPDVYSDDGIGKISSNLDFEVYFKNIDGESVTMMFPNELNYAKQSEVDEAVKRSLEVYPPFSTYLFDTIEEVIEFANIEYGENSPRTLGNPLNLEEYGKVMESERNNKE